ncbi:MAG: MarR family winged helix-turn-helix transcriptional regulator [bacterium]|jgi:DNA-binding MarR family transcriptional regulator
MSRETFINRTISILHRYKQWFLAQRLGQYGLSIEVGQIPVLVQVYRYHGISQDGISTNAVLDKGTVARVVKQLEESGLVVRQTDECDRRVNRIYPTPKALELEGNVFGLLRELQEIMYQGFTQEEIEHVNSLLERMKGNIERIRPV